MVENPEIGEKQKGRRRSRNWRWGLFGALMAVSLALAVSYVGVLEIPLLSTQKLTPCNQVQVLSLPLLISSS